ELDWSRFPVEEQQRRFEELRHRERHTPRPLSEAPLLRFSLIRLGREHGLIWTAHHLLMDGWSLPLLVQELQSVYAAPASSSLPPVRPFSDYVVWLGKQDSARAEPFWRGDLAGFTAPNVPGIDKGHGAAGYAEHGLQMSHEATARLQALASRHKLTLQTVTLGAWAVLVSRYSADEDVVFGNVVSGRPAALPGVETMVGMFINTLPVRVRVNGAELLGPWLQRLQERQLARQEFEQSPLAQIQRWSEVPAGSPLFETLYVFENYPDTGAGGPGSLRVGNLRSFESTNYPLTLALTAADHISCRLRYDRARIDEASALRLLGHLGRLLASIGERPEQALRDLQWLSEAERHQLAIEWNPAGAVPDASVIEMFESWADRTPDAIAVLAPEETLTYAELDRRADQLAHHLRTLGVTVDSRVGLSAERSPAMIVGVLGILKAGAAYVPLDPTYPRERLAFMVEDSQIPVLLTEEHVLDALLDAGEAERLPHATTPDSLSYLIYTSGSTGRPKGAMIPHRGWSNLAEAQRRLFGLGPGDRVLQFASLGFDASAWEIALAFGAGATLVLGPRERRLSREELTSLLRECTAALLPPTVLATLSPEDLPGLETLHVGGEACPVELALAWSAGRRLWNAYGPTEASVCATVKRYEGGERLPIGRPISGAQAHVLDAWGNQVPAGVMGELCLGGPGLARGYLDRPDGTAASFVPHPFAAFPGERLYRTGDLARYRPDGEIELLGRRDHQVKVRGFRIELGEIEAALAALPGNREAVVVMREDVPGDRRLVAYVVGDAPVEELRRSLRGRLPDYMVPSAIVTLAALPLTPSGKVDRKALPAPEPPVARESYVAPRTR
ncbi:MAG TPA: amino acid adenylation domain-containing protein, partial [Thermoanaerobaculia bacterium]|nr:amino acid adenylation domain-containing protein [Thermoanaerobaculia bacterium]